MSTTISNLKIYGQLVIGPPGSGKTTYCHKMNSYLKQQFGDNNVLLINMDPGNDILPYTADLDVSEIISVVDAMEKMSLGPNGALVYCMDFIDSNFEEHVLSQILKKFESADANHACWVLFDMPGQIELYTHVESIKNIVKKLTNCMSLCTLNLVDSHYCNDAGKYISCLLTCLSTMLHLSTPHINVLSKISLLEKQGQLPFDLEFYTDVLDLSYLTDVLESDKRMEKYKSLNDSIASIVENYGLVSFYPLDVENESLVEKLAHAVDKALGRVVN